MAVGGRRGCGSRSGDLLELGDGVLELDEVLADMTVERGLNHLDAPDCLLTSRECLVDLRHDDLQPLLEYLSAVVDEVVLLVEGAPHELAGLLEGGPVHRRGEHALLEVALEDEALELLGDVVLDLLVGGGLLGLVDEVIGVLGELGEAFKVNAKLCVGPGADLVRRGACSRDV